MFSSSYVPVAWLSASRILNPLAIEYPIEASVGTLTIWDNQAMDTAFARRRFGIPCKNTSGGQIIPLS